MAAEEDFLFWKGFRYRWRRFPHRLSILKAGLFPGIKSGQTRPEFHAKIGNWPKEPAQFQLGMETVTGLSDFKKTYFETELTLEGEYGHWIENEKEIALPVEIKSDVAPKATLLLENFSIRAMNNESGWHFGGLKIFLHEVEGKWKIQAAVRPTWAPEPLKHGNRSWSSPGYPICEYKFTVGLSVLQAGAVEMKIHSIDLEDESSGKGDYSKEWKLSSAEGNPKSQMHLPCGFSLELTDAKAGSAKRGRYLRELGVMITRNLSGEETASLSFSNKGPVTYPWILKSRLLVTCIQFSDLQTEIIPSMETGWVPGAE